MDLTPTSEHEALREVVAAFVAETTPPHRFAEIFDGGDDPATDPSVWARLAEMGLLGLSVPEDLGGAGAGLVEETILFEELGAGLLPAPVFSTVALCLPLLVAAPDAPDLVPPVVDGSRRYALAATGGHAPSLVGSAEDPVDPGILVAGPAEAPELSGERTWVLDAAGADGLLVPVATPAGPAVYLVDADAATSVTRMSAIDRTQPAFRVQFSRARARLLLAPAIASTALATVRRRTALLASAEAVGISRRMLSTTADYCSTRTQFGRPIATYQGVSHQLADTYIDVELARSLVLWAALEPTDTATLATAVEALPAAVRASERAIQLHGGIGMTWDAVLHRYYKHALLRHALVPRPGLLRAALARTLLDT